MHDSLVMFCFAIGVIALGRYNKVNFENYKCFAN